MNDKYAGHTSGTIEPRFDAGVDDVIILPLVLVALGAKYLFKVILSILIHILDFAFPILLQLARFPLFTLRIIGDGVVMLLKGVVKYLPVSGTTRDEWRKAVSRRWAWLRQKISYKAFEEAVHHAFEGGMAWVFRKCRTLTPRTALLVIAGAVLWLPVSFGFATAMHAFLIAKATSLPAWMQLLHPFATIIAKSKLLVLPVYPAAWPQAKKHPFMQATFRLGRYVASLLLVQKTKYRYRQTEWAVLEVADGLGRAAAIIGLKQVSEAFLAWLRRMVTWTACAFRAAIAHTGTSLSKVPLVGSTVAIYAARYASAGQHRDERLSKRTSEFFRRWSIKFSAKYYEEKEMEEAAKHHPVT